MWLHCDPRNIVPGQDELMSWAKLNEMKASMTCTNLLLSFDFDRDLDLDFLDDFFSFLSLSFLSFDFSLSLLSSFLDLWGLWLDLLKSFFDGLKRFGDLDLERDLARFLYFGGGDLVRLLERFFERNAKGNFGLWRLRGLRDLDLQGK